MSATVQPRTKDHWSLRLRVKRPGAGGIRPAMIVLALVQALLLALTASSLATGGGLYGCSTACVNAADQQPLTPAIAVFFGMLMLVLPVAIGALAEEWPAAVAFAVLPWFPALLIAANTLLAPTNTIVPPTPAKNGQPAIPYATSKFGPPFWLDGTHLPVLLFSLALFAFLGWLGWTLGRAFRNA